MISLNDVQVWFHDLSLSQLTHYYIFFLISLFLFFSSWCFAPIILRWVQIRWNIMVLYYKDKKKSDLPGSRTDIQDRILRRAAWARADVRAFRMAWEEARLPGEDMAVCPTRLREFLSP